MKRISLFILALMLVLGAAACTPAQEQPAAETPSADVPAGDTIICRIGDVTLLRSDFEVLFNLYFNQYVQAGYDMTNEANIKALQDAVFNSMVRAEVIYQQAVLQGITLTADEETQVATTAQAQYDELYNAYIEDAKSEGAADTQARATELFTADLDKNGFTLETFIAQLQKDIRKSMMAEKLEAAVTANVIFTEEDALARFPEDMEADRAAFAEDISRFDAAQNTYDANGGIPPLYVPEGYVRVKHILVADEETALALIDRIHAGEDFDALMAEYGTDPGMQAEPNKSLGYLMSKDTNFMAEFKKAGLALENAGDISAPVATDYGYHIIKLVNKLESGARDFAQVKDDYISGTLALLKAEEFETEVTGWTDALNVTSYIGRIRDLGKAK